MQSADLFQQWAQTFIGVVLTVLALGAANAVIMAAGTLIGGKAWIVRCEWGCLLVDAVIVGAILWTI